MKPSHIEHIGIAVRDLESSIEIYENILGLKCYKIEEVPEQKVRTAFFRVGQTKIELLETTDKEGPIGKFIEKRGEGIHHIAFAVKDIERQLQSAENNGGVLIDRVARKGADNMDIAFIHPKSTSGVLVEICEDKSNK
jgi:methylmalonyl-CoA/ethylmalonyl-CoA epimerase